MNPLAPVTATRPLMRRAMPCQFGARQLDWRGEGSAGSPPAIGGRACTRDVVVHVPSVPAWSHDRARPCDARRARLGGAATGTAADVQPSVPRVVHGYPAPDARLDLPAGFRLLRLGGTARRMVGRRILRA